MRIFICGCHFQRSCSHLWDILWLGWLTDWLAVDTSFVVLRLYSRPSEVTDTMLSTSTPRWTILSVREPRSVSFLTVCMSAPTGIVVDGYGQSDWDRVNGGGTTKKLLILRHFNLFNWNLISFALEINCSSDRINQTKRRGKPQGFARFRPFSLYDRLLFLKIKPFFRSLPENSTHSLSCPKKTFNNIIIALVLW